ncbi:MAG: hypothetical protein SGARI_001076 [Bacillariaceae sp.]
MISTSVPVADLVDAWEDQYTTKEKIIQYVTQDNEFDKEEFIQGLRENEEYDNGWLDVRLGTETKSYTAEELLQKAHAMLVRARKYRGKDNPGDIDVLATADNRRKFQRMESKTEASPPEKRARRLLYRIIKQQDVHNDVCLSFVQKLWNDPETPGPATSDNNYVLQFQVDGKRYQLQRSYYNM